MPEAAGSHISNPRNGTLLKLAWVLVAPNQIAQTYRSNSARFKNNTRQSVLVSRQKVHQRQSQTLIPLIAARPTSLQRHKILETYSDW
jgi:hypothetical protein